MNTVENPTIAERAHLHIFIAVVTSAIGLAYMPDRILGAIVATIAFFLAFVYCCLQDRWRWAASVVPIAIVWTFVSLGDGWIARIAQGIFLAGLLYWICTEAVRTTFEFESKFHQEHPGFTGLYCSCVAFNIRTREIAIKYSGVFEIKPFSYIRDCELTYIQKTRSSAAGVSGLVVSSSHTSNDKIKVTLFTNDMERPTYTLHFLGLGLAQEFEHRVRMVIQAQNASGNP